MALDVNGSTQYVNCNVIDVAPGAEAMSLFAWCYTRITADVRIIAKADGADTVAAGWWLTGIDSGGHKSRLKTGGTTHTMGGGGAYALNTWIHTGFTYHSAGAGGAGWLGYKDGVQIVAQSGKTGTISVDATLDFWIGGNPPTTNRQWDGLIADVRIYDRALSANEMQTVFAARGADGIAAGLVHRWPLDELALGVAATGVGAVKDVAIGAIDGDPVASPTYAASEIISTRRRVA